MPPRAKAGRGLTALTGADSDDDLEGASNANAPEPAKRPRGRPPAAVKTAKPVLTKAAPPAARGRPAKAAVEPQSSPRKPLAAKSTAEASMKGTKRGRQEPKEEVEDLADVEEEEPSPKVARTARGRPAKKASSRHAAAAPEEEEEPEVAPVESDVEVEEYAPVDFDDSEMTDSALRRKLGEMTKKYENLAARHRDLRNTAVTEADKNFERLRKQADESAAASTELINELKAELAAQKLLIKEGAEVRKQLERSQNQCESLETKVDELNDSLLESNKEVKTLSTKLTALRSAEAAAAKVPGSALKPGATGSRGAPSEALQVGQAKEDLYGDLTGLILSRVRLGDDEDVFDCIQTGKNGTLHFKLLLDKDPSENYENVEFTYQPQLDEERDAELLDLLPDFLTEEITFPRTHAGRFYARVIKALTS